MHFSTVITGLAAFTTAVTAAPPQEKPYVGVAMMTYNDPVNGESSSLPQNVPLGVLTHQDNVQITELEIEVKSDQNY